MEYISFEKTISILLEETNRDYGLDSSKENHSYTIVYIDDDPLDTWLAEQAIMATNIATKVLTASNGLKGLQVVNDYYERHKKMPDIIIADLLMPLMDGFALLDEIKKLPFYSENETTLILITVGLDDSDLQKINKSNVRHVLLKPFDKVAFLTMFHK